MTSRTLFLVCSLAALSFHSWAQPRQQNRLPPCPKSPQSYWDRCTGIRIEGNGGEYTGEFRAGKFNGRGTETFPNGNVYEGEFRDGKFNGQGTFTFANGYKYVGEFRDGERNGQGSATYGNGYQYTGEFRDGQPNGQGTFTLADGTRQTGPFRDGHYMGPASSSAPAAPAPAAPSSAVFSPPPPPRAATAFEVALQKRNGVLLVPVLINDQMPLDFVLDSGASDVSIPASVVVKLMHSGTLTRSDFTGTSTYLLADGSTVPSQTFRLRSIKVGNVVLHDVPGSVAPGSGLLLLGQSFLSRFKSWSIDNARGVLVLQ